MINNITLITMSYVTASIWLLIIGVQPLNSVNENLTVASGGCCTPQIREQRDEMVNTTGESR